MEYCIYDVNIMTEEINTMNLRQRLYDRSQFTSWRQRRLHVEYDYSYGFYFESTQNLLTYNTNHTLNQIKLENI
jgi:hypothetical protein